MSGSVYRTAKGTHIDMLKLVNQNEMTIAVGNMNVNARGDKLGPGGQVIRKREELTAGSAPAESAVVAAPVQETKSKSTSKKDVSDMDPEGNE